MVNFVLSALESNATLGLLGNVFSSPITDITSDARAVFYVSESQIKSIFRYQTDSFDTINDPDSDIKYYTDYMSFTNLELNPANAMLNVSEAAQAIATTDKLGNELATNKMLVAHDFLRHMAEDLFGTHLGVDLFNNEKQLIQNIRDVCGTASESSVMSVINAAIQKVSKQSTATLTGLKGDADLKYMTNENTTNENLCRVLFNQMMGAASARFASVQDTQGEQALPFEVDDSVNFKLTIHPASGQKLLTRSAGDAEVANRSYEIRLVVVSDSDTARVNTAPAADEA
jgi:hypothetical protein